jgi:ABC-type phosphate/phosphonate transport system substrate-binding protein
MKRVVLSKIVLSILICLFLTGAAHGFEEDRLYRIGVLAKRGKEICLTRWTPTAQYLTGAVEGASFSIVPLEFQDILPAVEENTIDFLLSNPAYYIKMEINFGAVQIATLENIHNGISFGSVMFHRAGRDDINHMADLEGKRVMAVAENSFGGWIMAWREMEKMGIDPHSDFSELTFGYTHDTVVYAVRDGLVDLGIIRSDTLEEMADEGKIKIGDFQVLHEHMQYDPEICAAFPFLLSTRLYPEWPLARLKQTPRALSEKLLAALLLIEPDNPAAVTGLYAGWTVPANYQMVRDCLKELRIDPYQDYGRFTIRNVILKYWYWLVSIAFLLSAMAGIILYLRSTKNILKKEIDARQKTEADLQFERAQFRSIFNSVEEIVYVSDPRTYEIIFTNMYFQKLLGKNPLGGVCYREFQNLDRPCDFCTNEIILRNKGEAYRWEYFNPVLDKYFLLTDRIIKWPDGRDVRFELAIDITEQKRAQNKLEDSGENLEEMVERKTSDLRKTVDLMAGREVRMMELKKAIRLLRSQIEEMGMVPVADDPLKGGIK